MPFGDIAKSSLVGVFAPCVIVASTGFRHATFLDQTQFVVTITFIIVTRLRLDETAIDR